MFPTSISTCLCLLVPICWGTLTRPQYSSTFRPCSASSAPCMCDGGTSYCSYMGLTETKGVAANYSGCLADREVSACCLTPGWSYLRHAHSLTCVPNVATVVLKGEGSVNDGVKDCRDARYPYCRSKAEDGKFIHRCLHRSHACNGQCGKMDTWCDVTRTCIPSTDHGRKCRCDDGTKWCHVTRSCVTGECHAPMEGSTVVVGLVSGCGVLVVVLIILLAVWLARSCRSRSEEQLQNINFTA